jgi:ABC-type transport system involved in multi-copper enzyme maturation permease subunit
MDFISGSPLLLGSVTTWMSPLWRVAAGVVATLVVLLAIFLLLRSIAPRVMAIAATTAKEALSQPLFYILLVVGAVLLIVFPFVPYFTFGEDIKMVKEMGLTVIMLISIFLAVWTASASVADEIEGRTALTLLSKPISRRKFILGKFVGVLGPVLILLILLGGLFVCTISYKVVYDARESAMPEPSSMECIYEMALVTPGLVLAFFETIIFTSICVAVATRLPMLGNLIVCASIYALGNLLPTLVYAAHQRGFELGVFVAQLLATILPGLDNFDMYTAISTGNEVPLEYLAWALLYCIVYSTAAMLVALLLFEERDLA